MKSVLNTHTNSQLGATDMWEAKEKDKTKLERLHITQAKYHEE